MNAGVILAGAAALIGGILVAAQGPIYARLSLGLARDHLAAVFLAFLTASLVTGILVAVSGHWRSISPAALAALPPWVWLGGLLGACHVMISMQVIPVLGVGAFLTIVIAGNLVGAAIYDHFGLMGVVERPISALRLAGIGIVLAGVVVTLRG